MEKETTTKKEKSKIVVLEGSKVYSKLFLKHKAPIKAILSIVAVILLMVAFVTFFKDISDGVNVIKEWTTSNNYFYTTYQVFFVSEANLPIVANCVLSAFIIFALANLTHVKTILSVCKSHAKKLMRKQPDSNIIYYEALNKESRTIINNNYGIGKFYGKIRRQTILQALFSFFAMITTLVLGLCAYKILSNYEYAKELFLYVYNYSSEIDLADFELLKIIFFSAVAYSVFHAIASAIINSKKSKLNVKITKILANVFVDANELFDFNAIVPKTKTTTKTTTKTKTKTTTKTFTVDPNKNLVMTILMAFNEDLTYLAGYVKEVSIKVGDIIQVVSRTGEVIYDKKPIVKLLTEDCSGKRKKMVEAEEAFFGEYAQIVLDGNLSIKKGMRLIKLPNA